MTDTSKIRLDPAPSKMFSFLEFDPDAPEVRDEATSRLIQPAGPVLHVRYRTTGLEQTFWPVSLDEAQAVFSPNAVYDFSIGRAFNDLIKSRKSSRQIKSGERQSTVKQREETEQRAGRRWLA